MRALVAVATPETEDGSFERALAPTANALRAEVAREGHRCRLCRGTWRLMVHHVTWRSEGEATSAENCVTLCGWCHGLVHEGLLVISGEAPPAPVPQGRRGTAGQSEEGGLEGIAGQEEALRLFARATAAARREGRTVPHCLIDGPAGTGKTTFARAIAAEMGTEARIANAPLIRDAIAVIALLCFGRPWIGDLHRRDPRPAGGCTAVARADGNRDGEGNRDGVTAAEGTQ